MPAVPSPVASPPPDPAAATYTVDELAQLLRCSPKHVRRLARDGEVPGAMRCGRLVRFAKAAVDRWLAAEVAHAG